MPTDSYHFDPQTSLQSAERDESGFGIPDSSQLRELINRIPDIIWTADQSGRIVYISPNVETLLGITPADVCDRGRQTWLEAIHPDDRSALERGFAALFARGEHYSVEFRIRRHDGCWRWLHARAISVYSRAGRWYADGLASDVTDRKHGELLLRASEERLKILIGCAKGIAFEFDCDGTYLAVWTNDESLLARPARELCGRTIHEVLGAEFANPLVERLRRVLATGVSEAFEYSLDLEQGRRWFVSDLVKTPVADHVPRVAMLIRDITELKSAVEGLRESEERFRSLIEATPDAVGVARNGQIRFINPAMLKLLGLERPDQLLGKSAIDFVFPADREHVAASIQLAMSGQPSVNQHRLLRSDGSVVDVEASRLPLEYDGETAALAIIRDLTERKRLEAHALSMDRLASIGRLAAGVGHEINNPLAYVIENLSLAVEALGPSANAEVVEMLQHAQEGAERIRNIARDLKTFSRGEDDKRTEIDVARVLDSAINMAFNEIRHRAELVREFGQMPCVIANESRLGQVFLNLLVNAAQAIPEGHAKSHRIVVRTRRAGERVVIEVSDTGSGICEADMPRIFDGFFTTKPVGIGTGLGLSISRDIVHALGGTIEVESTVGVGSSFRVLLPIASRSSATKAGLPVAVKGRGRVLVVDDEPLVGMVLRKTLGREHEVTVTQSASEALQRLRKGGRFDVIFCDLMMPEVTGMEFYTALEGEFADQAERVVFLTGGSFTPSAHEFLDRTTRPVIEKPFDGRALCGLVAEIVRYAAR